MGELAELAHFLKKIFGGSNFSWCYFVHFRDSLKLKVNLVLSYVNLAAALTSIQDYEGAIKAHMEALQINPNLYGVRSDLGNIFKSLGRLEEAEVRTRLEMTSPEPTPPNLYRPECSLFSPEPEF